MFIKNYFKAEYVKRGSKKNSHMESSKGKRGHLHLKKQTNKQTKNKITYPVTIVLCEDM